MAETKPQQPDDKPKQYLPKETLYIRNLNQKIKSKDMKHALYILFSSYGEIKEIVAKKNNKMRGQAFVIFNDIAAATSARNNLDRYIIFEKAMRVQFSAKRSKVFNFNVKD